MSARRIIEDAAFGPDVVRAAIEAFARTWNEIADRFDSNTNDAARVVLADAIITATGESSSDPELLRSAGICAMIGAYPERFASPLPPRDEAEGKVY